MTGAGEVAEAPPSSLDGGAFFVVNEVPARCYGAILD